MDKIAYPINQSLTYRAYSMPRKPKCLHFGMTIIIQKFLKKSQKYVTQRRTANVKNFERSKNSTDIKHASEHQHFAFSEISIYFHYSLTICIQLMHNC